MKKISLMFFVGLLVCVASIFVVEIMTTVLPLNAYVHDFIFYFIAPISILGLSAYYYRKGSNLAVWGLIASLVIYYPVFWFVHLWGMGEQIECTRFFFNLFSNCPLI
jgi:hypothetical protein